MPRIELHADPGGLDIGQRDHAVRLAHGLEASCVFRVDECLELLR